MVPYMIISCVFYLYRWLEGESFHRRLKDSTTSTLQHQRLDWLTYIKPTINQIVMTSWCLHKINLIYISWVIARCCTLNNLHVIILMNKRKFNLIWQEQLQTYNHWIHLNPKPIQLFVLDEKIRVDFPIKLYAKKLHRGL